MHFTVFRSSDPFDHIPRVLDQMRRMGLFLRSVSVFAIAPETTEIRVVYGLHCSDDGWRLPDAISNTFLERVRQMPGVKNVTHGHAQP